MNNGLDNGLWILDIRTAQTYTKALKFLKKPFKIRKKAEKNYISATKFSISMINLPTNSRTKFELCHPPPLLPPWPDYVVYERAPY